MKIQVKRQVQELTKRIRERRNSSEVQQVIDLLVVLYESAKDELVTVPQQNFAGKQSEAKTYEDLIRMFTQEANSITPQE